MSFLTKVNTFKSAETTNIPVTDVLTNKYHTVTDWRNKITTADLISEYIQILYSVLKI